MGKNLPKEVRSSSDREHEKFNYVLTLDCEFFFTERIFLFTNAFKNLWWPTFFLLKMYMLCRLKIEAVIFCMNLVWFSYTFIPLENMVTKQLVWLW